MNTNLTTKKRNKHFNTYIKLSSLRQPPRFFGGCSYFVRRKNNYYLVFIKEYKKMELTIHEDTKSK